MLTRTQSLVAAVLFVLPALAAAIEPSDLYEVYVLAEESDPQIKAAEAAYLAAREARPQSRALLLPDVQINASASRDRLDIKSSSFATPGVEYFNDESYTLQITQPLYRQDRFVRLRQARDLVNQAEASYAAAQQALMVDVATRYFAVLGAIDNLEFAQAEREAIGRQLEQAQQRFEVGLIAMTDVHEAKASYDLSTAAEIDAERLLANANEALRERAGALPEPLRSLRDDDFPLLPPEPNDIEAWSDTALAQNPELLAQDFAAQAARREVRIQRAGHLPALDLIASYGYSDRGGVITTESEDGVVGIQLNLPLYQGGGTSSRVTEAVHREDQARQELEAARRSTLRQTRDAFLNVSAAISRVQALRQAQISSQSALEATEAGYEVGTRTTVDVLAARRELFRAKRDYERARYDYVLNTLRLQQASGTLSPADLQLVNTWLE